MKNQRAGEFAIRAALVGAAVLGGAPVPLAAQFASCTTAPTGSLCLLSGYVGIATVSPGYSLDVGSGAQDTPTPSGTVVFGVHGSAIFGAGNATTLIDSYSNSGALYFGSGNGAPSFSVTRSSNITNNDYTISSLRNLVFAPGMWWHSIFSVGNVGIGSAFSAGNGTSPAPPSSLSVAGGVSIGSYATSATNAGTGNLNISGSIGVGTQSPGYKLDVQGGQINASGGLCIAGSCQTDWPGSGTMTYSGKYVGIGTASPCAPLEVWRTDSDNASNTSMLILNHVVISSGIPAAGLGDVLDFAALLTQGQRDAAQIAASFDNVTSGSEAAHYHSQREMAREQCPRQ